MLEVFGLVLLAPFLALRFIIRAFADAYREQRERDARRWS